MSFPVVCGGCSAAFQAKKEWIGRKTKCPKCGHEITIADASPAAPHAGDPIQLMPVAQPSTHNPFLTPKAPVPAATKSGSSRLVPIVVGLLAVPGLLGLGYYLAIRSLDKPAESVAEAESSADDADGNKVEIQRVQTAAPPTQSPTLTSPDAQGSSQATGAASARVRSAAARQLPALYDAAEATGWQPTSSDNREKFDALIRGAAQVRTEDAASPEFDQLELRLSQEPWTMDPQVSGFNADAVEALGAAVDGRGNDGVGGTASVIFFGYIRSIAATEPNRFLVQLSGRGLDVEVVGMSEPKRPYQVGQLVVVLGTALSKNTELNLHRVSAPLVVRTYWSGVYTSTPLQICADCLRFDRRYDTLNQVLTGSSFRFAVIDPNPASLTSRTRLQVTLNGARTGFDGVAVPGSSKRSDDDLLLMFAVPPESIVDWGITSVGGEIAAGFKESFELTDYAPPGSTWPKGYTCRFQVLRGTELKNSRRHALWFRFKDGAPVPMHLSAVYQPGGMIGEGHVSLMQQLAYDPAEPTTTRALKQISINARARQMSAPRGLNGESLTPGQPSQQFATTTTTRRYVPGGPTATGTGPRGFPGSAFPGSIVAPNGSTFPNGAASNPYASMPDDSPPLPSEPQTVFERVELPGFRPEDIATSVVVAKLAKPDGATLALVNPDISSTPQIGNYEIVSGGNAKEGWSIQSVNKKGDKKPIARLTSDSAGLQFRWESGMTRADGGGLRNCVLRISGDGPTDRLVVLRNLTRLDPLVVDLKKDLERIPLGDDLPGDAGITLYIDGIDGAPAESTITDADAKFRTATFIVVKPAELHVPGVRLRLVLWKNASKNELVMRPEMTPVTTSRNLAFLKKTSAKLKTGKTDEDNEAENEEADPTASSSSRYLTFSFKGLGMAKTIITNQLKSVREQIIIDDNLILTKESQLSSLSGTFVGTPAEITALQVRINNLRNEISALRAELAQLNAAVPSLTAQLEAFPPLERLGNSLNLKSKIRFRVAYQAGEYSVPLVQAGDGP